MTELISRGVVAAVLRADAALARAADCGVDARAAVVDLAGPQVHQLDDLRRQAAGMHGLVDVLDSR